MTTIRSLDNLKGAPHANVFPGAEPKTVRLSLDEGEEVPPHDHPDREIVLYVVDGTIELRLDEETHEIREGDVARFDGDREVSPAAIEDSTALIVLGERSGR